MLFVASCSAEKPRCRGGPVTRRRFLFFADSSQWNLRRIAERNGNVIRERELAASISPPKKNPKVPEASSIHFDLGLSAPYLDLPFLRSGIPSKSLTPRIRWDFTPGESFTLPPLTKTIECSCELWPSPGMWANISCRLLNRTFAILRRAELGFFGVLVETRRHTPCFWGHWSEARVRSVRRFSSLPWRINWFFVGIPLSYVLPPFALSKVVTPDPKHPFSIHREIQSSKSIKRPSWTKIQTDQSC